MAEPDLIRGAAMCTICANRSDMPVRSASAITGTRPAHDTRLSSSNTAESTENLCETCTGSAFPNWVRLMRETINHRSSFLKERGRSRPRLVVFSLVCELPDPGWRAEIGVGGQGSGGARPRKRPQGLDGDAVRRTLFRTGESKRLVLLSACGTGWSVSSSRPVSRRGAGEGLLGHSFAAR